MPVVCVVVGHQLLWVVLGSLWVVGLCHSLAVGVAVLCVLFGCYGALVLLPVVVV